MSKHDKAKRSEPPQAPAEAEEKTLPAKREEKPAPEKSPAPAEHPETLSADHGYPAPRRCAPQE